MKIVIYKLKIIFAFVFSSRISHDGFRHKNIQSLISRSNQKFSENVRFPKRYNAR